MTREQIHAKYRKAIEEGRIVVSEPAYMEGDPSLLSNQRIEAGRGRKTWCHHAPHEEEEESPLEDLIDGMD